MWLAENVLGQSYGCVFRAVQYMYPCSVQCFCPCGIPRPALSTWIDGKLTTLNAVPLIKYVRMLPEDCSYLRDKRGFYDNRFECLVLISIGIAHTSGETDVIRCRTTIMPVAQLRIWGNTRYGPYGLWYRNLAMGIALYPGVRKRQ